jgi:hypothetical protein
LVFVLLTAGKEEVIKEFITDVLLLEPDNFIVSNLVTLSHGSVLFLVLLHKLGLVEVLLLFSVENTVGARTEIKTTQLRDLLELLERLTEHGVESDGALFFIDIGTSGLLSVHDKDSTERVPCSDSLLVRNLMTSSLAEVKYFDLVSLKLIVLLVLGHHLSFPLDVVSVSGSLLDFNFTFDDQESTPHVLLVEAHAFLFADSKQFSSRGPANVGDFLGRMVSETLYFETSEFVLVTLVKIDTLSHGSEGVILLSSFENSLSMSVHREASVDRLPVDAVEFGDFTLNWDNFVRDTVLLAEVENLNGALWLSFDNVVVLDGKVFTHGVHEHLEEGRSSEGG